MKPFLVCDFDGTVCLADVGNRFFEHFVPAARRAEWAQLITSYESGHIGSRECLERECALVSLTPGDALRLAEGFQVEPSFPQLCESARQSGVGLAVVSDGLDIYIRHILDRAGLWEVPVLANRAVFEGARLRPEFPWAGVGCGRCANCKGYHVEGYRRDHRPVVMIGDAHSDVCGALAADRVFARPMLAGLLAERCVAFEPFEDFDDISRLLSLNGTVSRPAGHGVGPGMRP